MTSGIEEDYTAAKYFKELAKGLRNLAAVLQEQVPNRVLRRLRENAAYFESNKSTVLLPQEKKLIS